MQLDTNILRHQLVYLCSLPDELLAQEMEAIKATLVAQFLESEREREIIVQHSEMEWGRIAIQCDSEDLPF
jgi:hypothetical protein